MSAPPRQFPPPPTEKATRQQALGVVSEVERVPDIKISPVPIALPTPIQPAASNGK